jgi:putative transposase
VGFELIWLWVAIIEPIDKEIHSFDISKERNMFVVAERFISNIIKEYGEDPVSTDGGTWYPQACKFLNLNHHIHSSFEKSIIERTMQQYIKDRIESLMTIFLAKRTNVN